MIVNIITNVVIAQVIAGWEEGFTGQCAGEKITMIVPPSLGYGDQASDKVQDIATTMADFGTYLVCQVPANSTLYFLTTLDGIVRVTKVTNFDKSLSILSHHHLGKLMSHGEYSELCLIKQDTIANVKAPLGGDCNEGVKARPGQDVTMKIKVFHLSHGVGLLLLLYPCTRCILTPFLTVLQI